MALFPGEPVVHAPTTKTADIPWSRFDSLAQALRSVLSTTSWLPTDATSVTVASLSALGSTIRSQKAAKKFFRVDQARVEHWLGQGAQATERAAALIRRHAKAAAAQARR